MATIPNVEINNVRIQQSSELAPGGQYLKKTVVTYMLGTHGPFTYKVNAVDFNPETFKSEYQKLQVQLRAIDGLV